MVSISVFFFSLGLVLGGAFDQAVSGNGYPFMIAGFLGFLIWLIWFGGDE